MRWLVVLAAVTGCYRHVNGEACAVTCAVSPCPLGLVCGGDGLCRGSGELDCTLQQPVDARTDTGRVIPDVACGGTVYGNGLLRVCLETAPQPSVALDGVMENTDTGSPIACDVTLKQANGPDVCVIARTQITLSGTLTVIGSEPLVLLGTALVDIKSTAEIHAESVTLSATPGAGSRKACVPNAGSGSSDTAGSGGGGAGGGGNQNGGAGGNGNTGHGAPSSNVVTPNLVVGGCPGGTGGFGGTNLGGVGGAGGGAIYLMSGSAITVSGYINASGAGGGTASPQGGGAGGGAGGFIGLDAPAYDVSSSTMFAIGGPGSSGGGALLAGKTGDAASTANDTSIVIGNPGSGIGGAGRSAAGEGGTDGTFDAGAGEYGGGGGGGGAGGFIRVANIATLGGESLATIVPPAGPMP